MENEAGTKDSAIEYENRLVSARPIRLLIVAPSCDILGGQAIQASRLLERLGQEPGLEVGFLAINPRLPGLLRKLQSIKYLRTVLTAIVYMVSLCWRLWRYDIVHIFSASYFSFVLAPTPAILISKFYGKKLLLNYHSGEAGDHLQRWRTAVHTIRLADEVVVPSDYLVGVFSNFGLRAKKITNLIDVDKFRFRERRPLGSVFLSNRNFEAHYGVDRVLKAFAIIQKRIPDARLIVAGDGPERGNLRQLAGELQLRNIEFTGRVPPGSISDLYNSADVFLNASEIDNQPLSILEAFACGLPVVTTDVGGITEIVINERTGLVVPKGSTDQLAAGALRLLEHDSLAQEIITRAYKECAKYRWETHRGQWLSIYEELQTLQGNHRPNYDPKGRVSPL